MTDLDIFLPRIMPYAPGCPEPTAHAAILDAARTFCERTRLWRDEDSFEITGDTCNVICVPDGAELFEIETASWDDSPLEPIAFADLERDHPTWRTDDGSPRFISQAGMDSIVLAPRGSTGTLRLRLFLKPSTSADELPDFLAKHYLRVIADGALAEILMIPQQPFTSPELATFYSERFAQQLDALFARNIKGQQRAPARTRPSYL
ncbi:hypothetical protein D3C76_48030 [compost metagenome]